MTYATSIRIGQMLISDLALWPSGPIHPAAGLMLSGSVDLLATFATGKYFL